MLLYRTIGYKELETFLFAKNPIYGSGRYQDLKECGCNSKYQYGIVCFFQNPVPFIDKNHEFEIVVDINKPMLGKGVYNVPKDFYKNPRFTHRGNMDVYIAEAYKRKYTIKEVKAINLRGKFAYWFASKIKKECEKEGIEFHNSGAYHFNIK